MIDPEQDLKRQMNKWEKNIIELEHGEHSRSALLEKNILYC